MAGDEISLCHLYSHLSTEKNRRRPAVTQARAKMRRKTRRKTATRTGPNSETNLPGETSPTELMAGVGLKRGFVGLASLTNLTPKWGNMKTEDKCRLQMKTADCRLFH